MKREETATTGNGQGITSHEGSPFCVGKEVDAPVLGRPPKYSNPEEMAALIEGYFADCVAKKVPATVAGLCVALDLSRQGLCEYAAKESFSDLIKRAKLRIEAEVESRLFGGNATGAIFWLKNHAGYSDKQEHEHTGANGSPLPTEFTIRFVTGEK